MELVDGHAAQVSCRQQLLLLFRSLKPRLGEILVAGLERSHVVAVLFQDFAAGQGAVAAAAMSVDDLVLGQGLEQLGEADLRLELASLSSPSRQAIARQVALPNSGRIGSNPRQRRLAPLPREPSRRWGWIPSAQVTYGCS
jgi:hypothetical protein